MNKNLVITALSLVAIMSIGTMQPSKAATTASQIVTATLGTTKAVQTNGGTISSTIDDSGNLVTALSPSFLIITNTAASQAMTLQATANTTTGNVNAFSGNGTTNYITLTNSTILPTAASVTNAQSASPVVTSNPNVITYQITNPTNSTGVITYTWNSTNSLWNIALTNKGNLAQTYTIPTGAAKSGTYSGDDEAGSYQATITLSFT
ncbi:MAG: hypothetical protein LKG27_00510 [Clostridiaceae bacterium]|jgi:hypothetical protein|nr:hypothetical protein [Clostridiaceae bacterium]